MAFDLDNEELKATRKLHRLNDDLYGDKKIKNDKIIAHKFAVMQQQINEKDSRIQELEEELEKANKQLDLDYVDDNYITKEKVKDKIEKYNRKMEEDVGRPKRKIEKMKCGICKKEIPKKQVRIDNMHYEFDEETEKLFTVDRQDRVTVCQKCYANLIWD